jgi:hypothetical protein
MAKTSKIPPPPLRPRSGQEDPIEPARIVHGCDDLWLGERLERRYNYLDYFFEQGGLRLRARAYLNEIGAVVVYPALLINSDDGPQAEVEAPELRAKAIAYLRRRFARIEPDDLDAEERREG